MQSTKIFQRQKKKKKKNEVEKKKIKIKKNISQSRKKFFALQFYCMRTFSYCKSCFAQNVSQFGSEYHFCSICGHKTRSDLADSVPLQLQDSICEKDIIWNYF